MCSIIGAIPPSWLRAAGPTKRSRRARLAAEAQKPVAKCKVPVFMGDRNLKKETNAPFDSGQSASCATEINRALGAKVSQGQAVEPCNGARGCSCHANVELRASGSTERHGPQRLTAGKNQHSPLEGRASPADCTAACVCFDPSSLTQLTAGKLAAGLGFRVTTGTSDDVLRTPPSPHAKPGRYGKP